MVSKAQYLPQYESPPQWIPVDQRYGHPDYASDVRLFLPRGVTLRREQGKPLGFNIRGGIENKAGIFVSGVMPSSPAENLGLKEGDQILFVNDMSLENIHHDQAVEILKTANELNMMVKFFPYGYTRANARIERKLERENMS